MKNYVNVLISTYNGEKYIADQIESVKQQTYPYINIYVRDDGSTDGTVQILKEYEEQNDITLICGENRGYGYSFLELLRIAEEGKYWAFCDQDDIWLPQKVEWSVEWLEKQNKNLPLLIGNSYELVNEDMSKVIGICLPPTYNLDFRRSFTDCLYQGFVSTFNSALRELMLKGNINRLSSHDWWAVVLVSRFGKSYYDLRIAAKHRRLDSSASVMTMKNRIKWMKKTLFSGSSDIRSCAMEFLEVFGENSESNNNEVCYAKWFAKEGCSFKYSLKKAFYPGRWRTCLSSEIVIRILMLFGRI